MRRIRFVFAVLAIAGAWVSPACKSNEVNQTSNTTNNYKVGPSGATFEVPGGPKIRIPAGAVDRELDITIREADADEYSETAGPGIAPSGMPQPWTAAGKVWAFEPHGLKFFLDVTMWLPAPGPSGDWWVMKSEPDARWEYNPGPSVKPVDGKVEFTTKSFSYYTLQKFDDPSFRDGGPVTPCEACIDNCKKACGSDSACADNCSMSAECARDCMGAPDASTGGDAKGPGSDTSFGDSSSCTSMCLGASVGEGLPCTYCGSPFDCTGPMGPDTYRCQCNPTGHLSGCMKIAGTDAGPVSDSATDTTSDPCGGCPAMTARLKPGDSTSPCCKTQTSMTCPGSSTLYSNSCSPGEYICRTGPTTCL